MRGIVLAGGEGSRLRPVTLSVSKQLLLIYDKPLIYYPISTLMAAGINEMLIISSPAHLSRFQNLLGDGSQFGIKLQFKVQESPRGITEALILGESFIDNGPCALILGDNIFHGAGIGTALSNNRYQIGANIFVSRVNNPSDYGVIELDSNNNPVSIQEKPAHPRSNFAITGLYFFDKSVVARAKKIKPSERGELEITDLIESYRLEKNLNTQILSRGSAWFDTGTFESMHDAATYVRVVQQRTNLKIACLEEIALRKNWINSKTARESARFQGSDSLEYIEAVIQELKIK
jgi:glucose-1-phosphate thymidylyltransferase